jgi:hypothetical protein
LKRAIVSRVPEQNLDENDRERRESEPAEEESEERAETPFDHPYFLPALLIAFTVWFGYDGWLDKDFNPEYITFNRWGFFILLPLAVYFTIQAVREKRGGK